MTGYDSERSAASFPIIAVGASAGGLEAFDRMIVLLPKELRASLVFLQHLSTQHKSMMRELILSKRPDLDIVEIADGTVAEPGVLYLAPPGKNLSLNQNTFRVTEFSDQRFHLPIDFFFSSLARERKEFAIAVVLSGAGSDGARGIHAIKDAGGTILVQDPATAQFKGMPEAVISTGYYDQVLSPESMVPELEKIVNSLGNAATIEDLSSPGQFQVFFDFIYHKTGLRFYHYKHTVIMRRVLRRMYLSGFSSTKDYLQLLRENIHEVQHLASDFMIGVTSFFRDADCWEILKTEVVRKIVSESSTDQIRIWTPACATGEEAYSVAMMFLYELELAERRREVQVFASDINEQALERARSGKYSGGVAVDIPPEYLRKYFTCSADESVTVKKLIRERVVFAKQDILTDPPFSRIDLIICRNLLIYLEPEAQKKCLDIFHYALKENRYLFLGNAESVGPKENLFKQLEVKKARLYQRISVAKPERLPISLPLNTELSKRKNLDVGAAPAPHDVLYSIQESLLEKYGPAAVAIDKTYNVIYTTGKLSRYFEFPRGFITTNLLDLIPDSLRTRFRGALYKAAHESVPVALRATMSKDGTEKRNVTIAISRPERNEELYLVVFQERGKEVTEKEEVIGAEVMESEETAVRQLENELSATRDDLQKNIEQLKSMNEEMQSSNEELQAANEELETSREELQSLNEELVTVNSQLQVKIEEQESTNNDLNNFLSSTGIPTIFLDEEFRVRRFTPAMTNLIKLIPSDIGRPISDLSQEYLGPELLEDVQMVLAHLTPVKKEIPINNSWHIRSTLSYRTSENRIAGVVVTYVDITERKKVEEALRESEQRFRNMFEAHQAVMLLSDPETGAMIDANPAAARFYGHPREKLRAMHATDINIMPPEQIRDLRQRIPDTEGTSLIVPQRLADGQIRLVEVYSTPIEMQGKQVLFAIMHDVTERKKAEDALQSMKEKAEQRASELDATLSSIAAGVIIYNLSGDIVRINEFVHKTLRYPPDLYGKQFQDRTLSLVLRKKDGELYRVDETPLYRALRGQVVCDEEMLIEVAPGEKIWISATLSPIQKEGVSIGVIFVFFDITERKRIQEQLQWQAGILDQVPDAIVVVDNEYKIQYLNKAAVQQYELESIDNVLGSPLGRHYQYEWVSPEQENEAAGALQRQGFWKGEYTQVTNKGKRIWVESIVSTVNDKDGKPAGLTSVNRDATVRKRLEQELERHAEELAYSNKELQSFTSSVSHDLRAPVRQMQSFASVLYEDYAGKLDEIGKDYLRRIINNSEKMNELIEDMLNLSKISLSDMSLQDCDLSTMAESIFGELRDAEPDRKVEAVIQKDLEARADLRLMKHALSNLIGNAWKYTGKIENARIEVGAFEKKGGRIFFVKDNGAGFNMKYAERLFMPFRRLHPDNEFPGTGIGLAIVERVIKRHGGKIWAEADEGKGAVFYFTLKQV